MAYNLTGLTDYVREHNLPLLKKSLFGSRTAELVAKQTGIKTTAKLNLFETDAQFQDGACAFIDSGSTAFTQRDLKVADVSVQEALCPRDLEKKWTQYEVTAGSAPDSVPFEVDFTDRKAQVIAKELEIAVWRGDTDSATNNLSKFDGFLKHIAAASASLAGHTSGSAPDSGSVIGIIDDVYKAIPADVIEDGDVRIFVGNDVFRTYSLALRDSNYFQYNTQPSNWEIIVPGTDIRVTAVNGLNTVGDVVAAKTSHMFIGVDLEDEQDSYEMWYSQDNRQVRFAVDFKMGTQIAFPDQVVWYQKV